MWINYNELSVKSHKYTYTLTHTHSYTRKPALCVGVQQPKEHSVQDSDCGDCLQAPLRMHLNVNVAMLPVNNQSPKHKYSTSYITNIDYEQIVYGVVDCATGSGDVMQQVDKLIQQLITRYTLEELAQLSYLGFQ